MIGNTFGHLFRLTTFGESHGKGIGGIIEGCPAGLRIDEEFITSELLRRRPQQNSAASTPRLEKDEVEFLSGIKNNHTLGTPIGFVIQNKDTKSKDYKALQNLYRPNHADYVYEKKYGIRDTEGGGRASARETVARVVAGCFAKLFLKEQGVEISSKIVSIGKFNLDQCSWCEVEDFFTSLRKDGDTVGGVIKGCISGVPIGLGEPVFHKLHADLGQAMLSIPSVKGFDYGDGFATTQMLGSEHIDCYQPDGIPKTNHSGGIQGGISNGQKIEFRIAFKPIPTLGKPIEMLSDKGTIETIKTNGRHDVCSVPRALPIVEAMAAMVIMDHWLLNLACKGSRFCHSK